MTFGTYFGISMMIGILLSFPFSILFFGEITEAKNLKGFSSVISCVLFWPILIIVMPIYWAIKQNEKKRWYLDNPKEQIKEEPQENKVVRYTFEQKSVKKVEALDWKVGIHQDVFLRYEIEVNVSSGKIYFFRKWDQKEFNWNAFDFKPLICVEDEWARKISKNIKKFN